MVKGFELQSQQLGWNLTPTLISCGILSKYLTPPYLLFHHLRSILDPEDCELNRLKFAYAFRMQAIEAEAHA